MAPKVELPVEKTTHESRSSPFLILEGTLPLSITTVKSGSTHQYFGVVNPDQMVQEFSTFVSENSDAAFADAEKTLRTFIVLTSNDYLEEKGSRTSKGIRQWPEAAWLTIRMSKPTDEYTTIPRWHRDGRMYDADIIGDVNSKYATTLLGNPTRIMIESAFVNAVLDEEDAFRLPSSEEEQKGYWAADRKKRSRLAERLVGHPLVEIPDGSIIRFSWGQIDAPVHSEPDMSSDRVFVSIIYGSEREIKDMCTYREAKYRV